MNHSLKEKKIMIKKILIGLASLIVFAFVVLYFVTRPTLENDGSYSPSSLALKIGTVSVTDFEDIKYTKYQGERSKILVIFQFIVSLSWMSALLVFRQIIERFKLFGINSINRVIC